MQKKIFSLNQISKIIYKKKKEKKKIALCHGVFDLLHIGHIKHLQQAKRGADYLIVSVTSDKYVNKGSDRPVFNEKLRLESLESLACVDGVVLSDCSSSKNIIKIVKPDFYYKGSDYKNNKKDITQKIKLESNLVKKFGGKTIYTNQITSSSSFLINKYGNVFNDEQKKFLENFKKNFTFKDIIKYFNKIKKIRALVVGETIIDKYIFSEVLGKSGKESYLAIKEIYDETYLGGAAAIAKHASTFSNKVDFLTMIGADKEYVSFIKKNLEKNIKINFIYKKKSPTILKKRYLDHINKNKLFGVYNINDEILDAKNNNLLLKIYKKLIKKSDLVIVSDYGHGFISKNFANTLGKYSNSIYLNAQVNAANLGYHSIKNYKKINTLIINENELRYEMRNKVDKVEVLARNLQNSININKIVVTRGKLGAIIIDKKTNHFFECPAFAKNIVDKVGAGDTMLSIMSLFLKVKAPDMLSLFVGSIAGAYSVGVMGNSRHLEKESLLKLIETTLK
jgi:rfaE bifunctional protein kinase chain/domain/rfaE bifunctional protein nucleotidyltransferase chain/domain